MFYEHPDCFIFNLNSGVTDINEPVVFLFHVKGCKLGDMGKPMAQLCFCLQNSPLRSEVGGV